VLTFDLTVEVGHQLQIARHAQIRRTVVIAIDLHRLTRKVVRARKVADVHRGA
jgi:hypothetical protein